LRFAGTEQLADAANFNRIPTRCCRHKTPRSLSIPALCGRAVFPFQLSSHAGMLGNRPSEPRFNAPLSPCNRRAITAAR
jgi:hypothetical protein